MNAAAEQGNGTYCVSASGGYMCLMFQNFLRIFMKNGEKSIDIPNTFFYYKRVRAEEKFCVGSAMNREIAP